MRFFAGILMALILVAGVASAQYPRGVIAEDCTATWCGYCPDAYAGLEVMKNRYDTTEFTSVRYYHTSGSYGTSETNARIAYYGVTGYPTVIFDGTIPVVGGGAAVASGTSYEPIVASEIGSPSHFKITVNSVDVEHPGSIDFDIEVIETIPDIGNVKIRTLLLENNVSGIHTDVTRDVLPDVNLTVSTMGESQNVVHNFDVDPTWDGDKWVAIFIQDDDDTSILQSASTRAMPDYSIRYWAKGNRAVITPSSGTYEYQDFAVWNLGQNTDVIRVTLDEGTMPPGWTCVFTDGVTDYSGYLDLNLNPEEFEVFHMKITSSGPGYATPRIVLTSNNLPGVEREIKYALITNDVEVLFVDDDGAETYEDYHKDAMDNYGVTYGIWDRSFAALTSSDLLNFEVVTWQTGFAFPTLDTDDRNALAGYLDGGGKLFITGQDIGWDLHDQGGSAVTWYHDYLHATYLTDDVNRNYVSGVPHDPITEGMALTLFGGDGANNNLYPSAIEPRDGWASPIFTYDGTAWTGAIKAITPVHRVVYLAFPYESIDNADDRRLLTERVLDWFAEVVDAPEAPVTLIHPTIHAFPNPAPGGATVSYALPSAGPAKLGIYALDGSLVRTLVDGKVPAGQHVLHWDGHDNSGNPVSSGVYFYRLTAADREASGQLTLTR
jgi:hypothetical protein